MFHHCSTSSVRCMSPAAVRTGSRFCCRTYRVKILLPYVLGRGSSEQRRRPWTFLPSKTGESNKVDLESVNGPMLSSFSERSKVSVPVWVTWAGSDRLCTDTVEFRTDCRSSCSSLIGMAGSSVMTRILSGSVEPPRAYLELPYWSGQGSLISDEWISAVIFRTSLEPP